jgi:hypothetical protein
MIWAKVKGEITQQNNTFRLYDVERLLNKASGTVTKEVWILHIQQAEQLQNEDLHKQIGLDNVMQHITINLGDKSD